MPFVSDSQRKWMFAKKPAMAAEWAAHTPKGKDLPEHVKKAVAKLSADLVAGGKADDKTNSDFDPKQLAMGRKVEMEHTDNPALSQEISRDHLEEFGNYYTALDKMEEELKKEKSAAYRLGVRRAVEKLAGVTPVSPIPLSLLAAGGGALAAPSGQRTNTAIMTGAGALGGGAIGNILGILANDILATKLKLPPNLLHRVGAIGGAGLGAMAGHRQAKKTMWGMLPRLKYEHNL